MRRVAYYLDTQHYGGVELSALALLRHLDRSRFEPVAYFRCTDPTGNVEMRRVFDELAIPVRELDRDGLPPTPDLKDPAKSRRLFADAPYRRRLLSSLMSRPGFTAAGVIWYHLRKTRAVAQVFRRERLDALHFLHTYYPSLEIPLLAAWLAGIPVRLSDVQTEPMAPAPKGWLRRFIAYAAAGCATRVRVMHQNAVLTVRSSCGIPLGRTVVITNGVDVDRFVPHRAMDGKEARSGKTVAVVARLSAEKGHRILIEAVDRLKTRHPEARYLFVGDGPLRQELEREVTARGLGQTIQFLGFRRDIPGILAEADLVVLPSLTEGLPWALLEAMAAAKPVIATRVGAVGEVVKDGVTGRLVEPGDPVALADALDLFLGYDADTLRVLGRAARRRVEARFSRRSMIEAFEACYTPHRRTRVAFYLDTRDRAGVELAAMGLFRHLDRSRFDAVVYFRSTHAGGDKEMRRALEELAIPVRELDRDGLPLSPRDHAKGPVLPRGRSGVSKRLRSLVKRLARSVVPKSLFTIWYHLRKTRAVAQVFRRERLDALHFLHTYYPSLEIPLLAAWLAGIPVRLSDVQTEPLMLPPRGRVRLLIARIASQSASHVRVMSSQIVDRLAAACGIPRARIRVIITGINLKKFPLREDEDDAGLEWTAERTVAVVARLSPEKGHRFLIEAVDALKTKYPEVRYLCIGDGPIWQDLDQEVAARGLEQWIQFLGFREDVHRLIGQSEFLLLPSLSEGVPWVVLEAMALGKPVLATRVGAVTDVMIDGHTGRLIEPGDSVALTRALDELLAADSETLDAMGQAARKRIEDHFSRPEALVEAFQGCYAESRSRGPR